MLNAQLNYEHFQASCTDGIDKLINQALTQKLIDDCDKYEDPDDSKNKQYLAKHIDYKTLRKRLWNIYDNYFSNKDVAKAEASDKDCIDKLFTYMFENIDKVTISNGKKREQIEKLQKLITDQNTEIANLDKQIENQKMYDEIKQSRIISSDKVRVSSITEYYIYIVLIVVFLLIQISLLVF